MHVLSVSRTAGFESGIGNRGVTVLRSSSGNADLTVSAACTLADK